MSLLARSGGVNEQLTFTGGVARNQAAVAALRDMVQHHYGERTINVHPRLDLHRRAGRGAVCPARRAGDDLADAKKACTACHD